MDVRRTVQLVYTHAFMITTQRVASCQAAKNAWPEIGHSEVAPSTLGCGSVEASWPCGHLTIQKRSTRPEHPTATHGTITNIPGISSLGYVALKNKLTENTSS
jgi:hypothetical protein